MIARSGVTVYRTGIDKDSKKEIFYRSYYPKCSVVGKVSVEKRHSRNGPWRERKTVIRIPVKEMPTVSVGDRVVLGNCLSDVPPESSLMVCGFADNCRGHKAVRHFKIVCR
ncbi:MAG: hypothetical protein IKW59_09190 [Clostridia bacterium]|nr:hypothetical protein [Clostridia bacterium]